MDITPIIPSDCNVITSFCEGGFKVNDIYHEGSIIIAPKFHRKWNIFKINELNKTVVSDVNKLVQNVDLLLIGTGESHIHLENKFCFSAPIEIMNSPAACRTYNVLLAEGRNIAAAIISL